MSKTILKLPATLTGLKSRVDRSYSLSFNTQELSPIEVAELSQNLQLFGTLGFAVADEELDQLEELDVPEVSVTDDTKTPSQRLRDRMFVYYKDKYKRTTGFQSWYSDALDEIGQKYLTKVS